MFKNILLSDIDIDASSEQYRKLVMINIGYIMAISVFILFAISNFFIQKNFFAGILEFIFAIFMVYGFIRLRKEKDIEKNALQANYVLFFLILIILFMFKFDNGVIFWALLFPFSATNLSGAKIGLRFIIVFNLIAYAGAYYYWHNNDVSLIEYIRFIAVSLIISMLVYFYEKSISNSFKIQTQLNKSLTNSIKETRMLAITDSLTGLFNKRHFDTVLNEEFNRAKRSKEPFILAVIDVDNFKLYNDHYGHDAGNDVLTQMGKTLKMQTLRSGDFAFRIGGEEFAIILQSSSKEDIVAHFENLRRKIIEDKIIHISNKPFGVITISIGIVSVADYEVATIMESYRVADKNLYYVKNHGRNGVKLSTI